MKKFFSGIIVGAVVASSITALAGGVWDKIDVLKNDIKVVVNGKDVTADNFLYNDTTYLPLRAVSEALNQHVDYDETTNTAYIGSKPVDVSSLPKGTIPNPLWIENENGIGFTNDEFNLQIHDRESNSYVSVIGIEELVKNITGDNSYTATSRGIYNKDTAGGYILEYKDVYYEADIPLEFYYTNIVPWLRTLSK